MNTDHRNGPKPAPIAGRVLCVVGWWPGERSVAGVFIREHVLAISAFRRAVVVHAEVRKWNRPYWRTAINISNDEGLPVVRITVSTPIRKFGVADRLIRRAYRKWVGPSHRKDPFALVHIHVRTEETEQAVHLAEALDLPIVLTEHNSYYHLGIRRLPPAEQAVERAHIRQWLGNDRIRSVMPVSQDLARVLCQDHGVDAAKITVVPNVATDVFRPVQRKSDGPFVMALAAVWRPPKDHSVFIEALQRIPPELLQGCRIDWTGYGPDMAVIQERCAADLPGVDIRFPGFLEKVDMARYMAAADVFVLPTTSDNLPCVILESLCCGTPVISMAVNGVPELVDSSNGILVPPSDPTALAQALMDVIRGSRHFDREAISRKAVERYSAAAVGSRIQTVYRSVLGPERPG